MGIDVEKLKIGDELKYNNTLTGTSPAFYQGKITGTDCHLIQFGGNNGCIVFMTNGLLKEFWVEIELENMPGVKKG